MTFHWLHISDIHLDSRKDFDREIVLEKLVAFAKTKRGQVDAVFATGDIGNRGNPNSYKLATDIFNKLLSALELGRERLFVVPGNHDIEREHGLDLVPTLQSRDESNRYFASGSRMRHFDCLDAFRRWYDDYFQGIRKFNTKSTCDLETISTRNGSIAVVLGNSTLFSGRESAEGTLWLGHQCLHRALSGITDQQWLRICLLHHPIICLHHDEQNTIGSELAQNGVDLVLFGHIHRFQSFQTLFDNAGPVHLGAGAIAARREELAILGTVEFGGRDKGRLSIRAIVFRDEHQIWNEDPGRFQSPSHSLRGVVARVGGEANVRDCDMREMEDHVRGLDDKLVAFERIGGHVLPRVDVTALSSQASSPASSRSASSSAPTKQETLEDGIQFGWSKPIGRGRWRVGNRTLDELVIVIMVKGAMRASDLCRLRRDLRQGGNGHRLWFRKEDIDSSQTLADLKAGLRVGAIREDELGILSVDSAQLKMTAEDERNIHLFRFREYTGQPPTDGDVAAHPNAAILSEEAVRSQDEETAREGKIIDIVALGCNAAASVRRDHGVIAQIAKITDLDAGAVAWELAQAPDADQVQTVFRSHWPDDQANEKKIDVKNLGNRTAMSVRRDHDAIAQIAQITRFHVSQVAWELNKVDEKVLVQAVFRGTWPDDGGTPVRAVDDLWRRTAASVRGDKAAISQIAKATGLEEDRVALRLKHAPGNAHIQTVFNWCGGFDAASLGLRTVASVKLDPEAIVRVSLLTRLSESRVVLDLFGATGNKCIQTAFANYWLGAYPEIEILGRRTAKSVKGDLGALRRIAEVTGLGGVHVDQVLGDAAGKTHVRNLFEWPNDDDVSVGPVDVARLGRRTAASALADAQTIVEIAELTELAASKVIRELGAVSGNVHVQNVFGEDWPDDD